MKRTTGFCGVLATAALVAALVPGAAFASTESQKTGDSLIAASGIGMFFQPIDYGKSAATSDEGVVRESVDDGSSEGRTRMADDADEGMRAVLASTSRESVETAGQQTPQAAPRDSLLAQGMQLQEHRADKLLAYDRALIERVGTQEKTGHTICCSAFSCAYADVVMDGTVHDHSYYTCSECTWTDWGGGGSAFRNVGSDEQVLREAYDQISSGKPTVVHVAASYGEHWIALIGYQGANDPDHLTLANFIALDPWDGSQIVAGDRFTLFGDGCQHVTER